MLEPTLEYAEASTFSKDETASATEAEDPDRIFGNVVHMRTMLLLWIEPK